MFSMLPNGIGVTIEYPDGTLVGDDYLLGNATVSDSGAYLLTSEEGCTTVINLTVTGSLSGSPVAIVAATPVFGTFPLEAMECNTPVIGKMPALVPEWMETIDDKNNSVIKNNGVWTNTHVNIPELISTYMKVWLEDSVPTELLKGMESTKGEYTPEKQKSAIEEVYALLVNNRKEEYKQALEQINKLETEKA